MEVHTNTYASYTKRDKNIPQSNNNYQNVINSKSKHCESHSMERGYYCQICHQSVCSDCIIIHKQHVNHPIIKLAQVQQQFNHKYKVLSNRLNEKKISIINAKEQISQSKNNCQLENLNHFMKKLYQRVNCKINNLSQKYSKEYSIHNNQFTQLSQTYHQLITNLQKTSKSKLLIQKGTQIASQIKEAQAQISHHNIDHINLASQLVPQYSRKKFILDNYTSTRHSQGNIYSQVFYCSGLEWRLKIYPNGISQDQSQGSKQEKRRKSVSDMSFKSVKNEKYVSIFIEMKSGAQKMGRYRHKLQIINQLDPHKKLQREFQSEFESGECWGYNHYARIQTLYEEGYIHPTNDSLEIILHVGPPSYYYATLDQNVIIQQKLSIIASNQAKIKQIQTILDNTSNQTQQIINQSVCTPKTLIKQHGQQKCNYQHFGAVVDQEDTQSGQQSQFDLEILKIYANTQVHFSITQ